MISHGLLEWEAIIITPFFLFEELKKLYKKDLINLFKTAVCGNSSSFNGDWGQVRGEERLREKEGKQAPSVI